MDMMQRSPIIKCLSNKNISIMKTKPLLHSLYFLFILVFLHHQQACTQNTRVKVKNSKTSYNYSGKDGRMSFSYKGEIVLSDDEKSIQSISPNGFLEYKVRQEITLYHQRL